MVLRSIIQSVNFLALVFKKGVKIIEAIDLINDKIKILGIFFSYNKKLKQEKNFSNHIVKIQNIFKSKKVRYEGRFVVCKLLIFSKIIHLALVNEAPFY